MSPAQRAKLQYEIDSLDKSIRNEHYMLKRELSQGTPEGVAWTKQNLTVLYYDYNALRDRLVSDRKRIARKNVKRAQRLRRPA